MRLLNSLVLVASYAITTNAVTDFSVTDSGLSTWNQSDWSLTTNEYIPGQYQSRLSLSNGYVGASLAAAGPFFEYDINQTHPDGNQPANVWPLFSRRLSFTTISGFYDIQKNGSGTNYPWLEQYGYESFISGIPHSTGIIFAFGDSYLDATVSNASVFDFSSSISFKTGVASWKYTWSPEGVPSAFNVTYRAIFSRERPNLVAVEASITPSSDISGSVTDILDGRSAVRSNLASKGIDENATSIYVAVHPNMLPNITSYVISTAGFENDFTDLPSRELASGPYVSQNDTTIGQSYNISLKAGQTATFYKFVGVASTDKFSNAEQVARQASASGASAGWNALLDEHSNAWGKIMTEAAVDNFTDPTTGQLPINPDIKILQVASVANTFYMMQNLQPDGSGLNDGSVAVGGLASESYAGLVFWDADYWMAPGLNLNFPGYTKQISNYRLKQHPQALANAAFNGYPNGSALYSWTSGRYGNCTGTGPCVDYEYHLNYDIAFNLLQQYNVTQNTTWFNNGPRQLIESVAMSTGELLTYNETTKTYWIHNMTDPDEYANQIDNGAFTIASAADLLVLANDLRRQIGVPINETWRDQAHNIEFPTAASNITLEYQTMDNSVKVKQADVVLLTYPLDYDQSGYEKSEKLLDLDYYSNRQSPDGPAMTYSIFAVGANAISPSGCAAYTYALNGMFPYLRAPWYQFSEQNNDDVMTNGHQNPAFPFLTGHGGANQIAPFGFLGLRTDQRTLYINPSLPPQIPHLRLRDFYFGGAGLTAFMNRTHTTLTRFPTTNIPHLKDIYCNTSMPISVGTPGSGGAEITYHISLNHTLTIPNRLYFENLTYPGNLVQCASVSSEDKYAPGQFPTAAIDGATATSWQPVDNETASLVVNMTGTPYQPLKSIYFSWGSRPPRNATVFLGNSTVMVDGLPVLDGSELMINVDGITLDRAYDVKTAAEAVVVPYVGNSTVVQLGNEAWTGDWARLVVEGCWEEDGLGATVAEFVLVGEYS